MKLNKNCLGKKRENYLDWDEFFMGIAVLASGRSKDPNTQVGACIVDNSNRILSVGYNGAPNGFDDSNFPWNRNGNKLEVKYTYVCHSELNSILNYHGPKCDLVGSKMYVNLFPCSECAKAIIQSGIKEVIYLSDKYCGTDENTAAKLMFKECGVVYKKYDDEKQKLIKLSLYPDEEVSYIN